MAEQVQSFAESMTARLAPAAEKTDGYPGTGGGKMELVQGYTRRQTEKAPAAGGLAGWVVGALQGRVRLKWKGSAPRPMQQMHLLETLPLGEKRQVMLVAYEGERYMVGCGPEAVGSIVKVTPGAGEPSRAPVKTISQTWL